MEWVETTAVTLDAAKEKLLDQLGVDEPEAEFDVLEEPRAGLFGRTKGQYRVRARVSPKSPPSRDDRRRRPKRGDKAEASDRPARGDKPADKAADADAESKGDRGAADSKDAAPADAPAARAPKAPARSARSDEDRDAPAGPRLDSEIAKQESITFLQGVLDRFGLSATIDVSIDEEGDLSAAVDGEQLGRIIGPRGGVISALEELTRTRLQHVASGNSTPRFKLDVGGYRASRRTNLETLVDEVVEKVRSTGQAHVLDVVLAGERKLVHDRVAEIAPDVATHSEGEDPVRKVVLSPA